MSDPPAVTWVRAALVVAAGVLGLGMLVGTAQQGPIGLETVLQVLAGWSFVACGCFLWARRPTNRLGPLMVLTGMLWLLGRTMTLIPNPVVFTVGIWFTDLWTAAFALFLLSFPSGRLRSRADRAIVGIFLFVVVPLEFLWLLFWVPENGLNILAIAPDESAAKVVDTIQRALISFGSVLLIIVVLRRWLQSSGPVRRQMVPVLVGAGALMLQLTAWLFATVNISLEPLNDLILASQIAIPIAVLYVLLQARMARGAVADLVVEWARPRPRPVSGMHSPTPSATPASRWPTGPPRRIGSSMRPASRWNSPMRARVRPSRCSSGTGSRRRRSSTTRSSSTSRASWRPSRARCDSRSRTIG